LSVAIILNLRDGIRHLKNGLLMLLSKLMLFSNALLKIFFFSLELLVSLDDRSNFRIELDDVLVLIRDLGAKRHSLLRNLKRFFLLLSILLLKNFEFTGQTFDKSRLVVDLRLVITRKTSHADIHCFFSSSEIFDNGSNLAVVTIKVFVRLDLSFIGRDDSLSDSLTQSGNLATLDVLILYFGIL